MTEYAIEVEGLSKQYRLGEREQYKALRDSLAGLARVPFRGRRGARVSGGRETLWALNDVSLRIQKGDVVGLIGRNGSGKSTLLKVLSRITEPTKGQATVVGRVGSLLEVGTGFHPELTGGENIYLNGAILGMKRSEIAHSFDEIVAFAEVGKFIDTPVKRYSSGMYVRLAFAVAAHLRSEILLVDEVLAVGDSAFQEKCLGKMGETASEGRTVVFVSHDMTNISVLCKSAVLLNAGQFIVHGPAEEVIHAYARLGEARRSSVRWSEVEALGSETASILAIDVRDSEGAGRDSLPLTSSITLTVEYQVAQGGCRLNPVFVVKNSRGTTVFSTANYEDPEWGARTYPPGHYRATCVVPAHILNDGIYIVDALLVEETRFVRALADSAVEFSIYDDGSTRGGFVGPWEGIVRPRCTWDTIEVNPGI